MIVHHAVRLWNRRQGSSLPRPHEEVMTVPDLARLHERSRGGTVPVRIHGCLAAIECSRRVDLPDDVTGLSLIVVRLRLIERYV